MTEKSQLPDTIISHLEAGEPPYLSICFQRPKVAGDVGKWDIYKKNIIQHVVRLNLENTKWVGFGWQDRTHRALDLIDVNGNHCGGWLLIFTQNATDIYELADTPDNVIAFSETPYLLPKITDNTRGLRGWVLAVDRDNPGFYCYDGRTLTNKIHELSFRSYADLEDTREPVDSVNYHTSGRISVAGSQATASFHALGSAVADYDEIQMKDFLDQLADAVQSIIAGTGRPLILAGDPKRVGWMKDALDLFELHGEHIELAGDALTSDRLLKHVDKVFHNIKEAKQAALDLNDGAPQTISGFNSITAAASKGKIDTLYLLDSRDGIQESESDERLKLKNMSDGSVKSNSNYLAIQVLSMGGRVEIPIVGTIETDFESFATLRY